MSARDWHVHEMLFGYLAAAMSGFLLTAVPNWTGRLPIQGRPLALLAAVWLAGRVAIFFAAVAPVVAAALDATYLALLAALIWREIIAGGNRRNIIVAAIVSAMALANVWWHIALLTGLPTAPPERLVLAAGAALIMLIGGRIVPSFTRNWLMKQGIRDEAALPASFGSADKAASLLAGLALALWAVAGEDALSAPVMLLAGLALAFRLSRWKGLKTGREPLVWILHAGYAWLPAWFVLMALAGWDLWPLTDALHALTAGAILVMTLAVMTRASLGHSGRALTADRITTIIYALAIAGALARVLATFLPLPLMAAWHLAGTLSAAALALFALRYAPMFFLPRARG